ncbi:MAG: hypothetical protein V7752_19285 [Halopseudomonas sp.]
MLSFKSLFGPKWQSQNPNKRCRAVSRLNPSCPTDHQILKQLALSDPAIEVRLQALPRLNDPELLVQLCNHASHTQIQALASKLLCELITAQGESQLSRQQLLQILSGIEKVELLTHIALNASDAQVRRYVVYQLEDEVALEQVVRFSRDPQQQRIAIQGIDEVPRLQQLVEQQHRHCPELAQLLQQRLAVRSRYATACA